MVIARAAVVPSAPLLVPELAGAAAIETAELREHCATAAGELATAATRWWAIGAGPVEGRWASSTHGTFSGFGVDVRVDLGPGSPTEPPDPRVPLPMLVAGWLRSASRSGAVAIEGRVLSDSTAPSGCAALGTAIAAEAEALDEPIALLIVGDGSATRSPRAPGTYHPEAEEFDTAVAAALARGDTATLAAIDPGVCRTLWVGGRTPWQVLAAAMPSPARTALLDSSAPFGVGYHVAVWTA